jgi:integrase/recombinase XerD
MDLAGVSEEHIKKTKSRLIRISEDLCYSCNLNDIIIYINKLKREFAPATYRKYILDLRRILSEINAPFVDDLKLPSTPKRRKIVIRTNHIRELLNQAEQLKFRSETLRLKAGILVAATSGLRSEELYKLTLNDIDLPERTIHIRAEIAKDYEDRVSFFSKEAQGALNEYLEEVKLKTKFLFSKNTVIKDFRKLKLKIGRELFRMKHCRKFFSQQSDRLGLPTSVKKMLMGHVVSSEEYVALRGVDVDLEHYDFQDEEDLKKIYDKYWSSFRIM